MNEQHDEYEEARHLLAPLEIEPTRPSTVDLQQAMADGRRRLRTRRVAGVGTVAAVAALVVAGVPAALAAVRAPDTPPVAGTSSPTATSSPSPAPFPVPAASPEPAPEPPTRCRLELPPVPADAMQSHAFGADPTGRIVYGKYFQRLTGAAEVQPVLWIDGELVAVDIPGNDANITAVNSSGVAVGSSVVGESEEEIRQVAWIYHDGEATELAGENAEPFAITEDGTVLGTRADRTVPVVWRSPEAAPEDLPRVGSSLILSEITPDGAVVGFRLADPERSFVWWPDGTVQDIPRPELDGETLGFRAEALNGHLLVGEATLWEEENGWISYIAGYDLRTEEYTILSQGPPLELWAMNRLGWIGGEADGYASLWSPEGGLLRLPDLGAHHEHGPNLPHWIAEDGRTITGVVEVEGASRAAVWRCD